MSRLDTWLGAILLVAFLLIFFSTPLVKFEDHLYSATDITQIYRLTQFESEYPKNGIFHDTVIQMQPWLLFNRESLLRGQIPLWNPYNANGVPHLANYQSSVFSIYSLPFYIFPVKLALLLVPFLKLAGIGVFTFLFLKQIGVGQLPAAIGATAFMFSGYNVVWLTWPVVGTVVTVPASLYFFERMLRNRDAASRGAWRWPLIGFTVTLIVGLLGGSPETFYACFLLVLAYVAFRLGGLWRTNGYSLAALRPLLAIGLLLSGAGALAATIAAVQLLPFFEYVANSTRGALPAWRATIPFWSALMFFPALLGNPANGRHEPIHLGNAPFNSNFNEANGAYVGSVVLFVSLLAVLRIRSFGPASQKYVQFFMCAAVLWFIYATNLLNLKGLFNMVPGVQLLLAHRTFSIPAFALSCCAALCLDQLLDSRLEHRRGAPLITLALGIAFLAVGIGSALDLSRLAAEHAGSLPPWMTMEDVEQQSEAVIRHGLFVVVTFALGLAGICGAQLYDSERRKQLCMGLVLLAIFGQSGWLLKDYNPSSSERFYYRDTPDIEKLRNEIQSRRVAVLGEDVWIANMNMPYKIPVLSSYDAVSVRYHDELLRQTFGLYGIVHYLAHFDEQGLRLTGVDTVIVDDANKYRGTLDPAKFHLVSEARNYAIYRYVLAVPTYRVVHHAEVASNDEEALMLVRRPDFDPATSVVLNPSSDAAPLNAHTSTPSMSHAELRSEGLMNVTLSARLEQPGYLVLTKTFYPGWKARVNGTSAPVLRANVAYSAVPLEAGSNRVEFVYEPESFRTGAFLSIVGLVLGVSLVALCVNANRRARQIHA